MMKSSEMQWGGYAEDEENLHWGDDEKDQEEEENAANDDLDTDDAEVLPIDEEQQELDWVASEEERDEWN